MASIKHKNNIFRIGTCFFIFLCMIFSSTSLSSKETIIWRVTDWPPFYILEGAQKGTGIYDELISMIARNLPEYKHKRVAMNTARARKQWSLGENVCHPSVIPENYSIHSVVNSILLPHQVIMHKDKVKLIDKDEVILEELLRNSQFRGGVTLGRYTKQLNNLVDKYKENTHLIKNPTYINLIKMLFVNRIDYIVEYSPIITFRAKQLEQENPTKSLVIQETQDNSKLMVVVGCTNNAWGRIIIDKIDNILKKESKNPDFLEFRLRWYDESSKKILRKFYQDFYFKDKN